MMNFPSFTYKTISVAQEGQTLLATAAGKTLRSTFALDGATAKLAQDEVENEFFLRSVEFLFNAYSSLWSITVETSGEQKTIGREEFFQTPGLWHPSRKISLEKWNREAERPHPVRNDRKSGLFYQRFVPSIGKTISFRGIDADTDLDTYHEWHNQPRVSFFWELALPKEELKAYLVKTINDPHTVPTFVELDGTPVGYFEMYWAREDRLGPYYESDAFDRGLHFLIGEPSALGFANTDSIMRSALHFLFLDDPRTRRVMAEPRHDNKKVLRYAESSGWVKLKEFDFPHKRAALLECKRENFFNGERL
jgi:acetyl CoA:N6-hydroxylysine acetyl transferase